MRLRLRLDLPREGALSLTNRCMVACAGGTNTCSAPRAATRRGVRRVGLCAPGMGTRRRTQKLPAAECDGKVRAASRRGVRRVETRAPCLGTRRCAQKSPPRFAAGKDACGYPPRSAASRVTRPGMGTRQRAQ
eukprot:gene9082-biopygen2793